MYSKVNNKRKSTIENIMFATLSNCNNIGQMKAHHYDFKIYNLKMPRDKLLEIYE